MSGADAFFVAATTAYFLPKQAKPEQNIVDLTALFESYQRDRVITTGDAERMFRDFLRCFSQSIVAIPDQTVNEICECVFGFGIPVIKKKLTAILKSLSKLVKQQTGSKDLLKPLLELIGAFGELPGVANKREFGKLLGEPLCSLRHAVFKYSSSCTSPIPGNVLSDFFARGPAKLSRGFKKQITAAYKLEERFQSSEDGDEPVEAYEKRWREGAKKLQADIKELFVSMPYAWIAGEDVEAGGSFDVDKLDTYDAMSAVENLFAPFKGIVFIGKFFALDKLTEKWNAAKSADGTVDGEVYLDFVTALLSDWLDKLPEAARKAYHLVDMRTVDNVDGLRAKLNIPESFKLNELEIPSDKKTTSKKVATLLTKLFNDNNFSGDVVFIVREKPEEPQAAD